MRITILLLAFLLTSCNSTSTQRSEGLTAAEDAADEGALPQEGGYPVTAFRETWGYLVAGREETLQNSYPLTDIGYFGAEVDLYGQLVQVPNPRTIDFYDGRIHLVVTCNGRSLTYFALEPGSQVRKQLIADLLAAARGYDGLQIDFELVPAQARDRFYSFLSELRSGLGSKVFSIALPARTRRIDQDVFDYQRILPMVDRILIMAYDEHWSTSAPGPIASMSWCRNVASYAISAIGPEKLIMGLPFYGRTWGNVNTNRAFYHSGIERIIREQNVTEIQRLQGIPHFEYEIPVRVTVYYEDLYSLTSRLELYHSLGVNAVGFWSLGQENPQIWDHLQLQ